MHSPQDELAAGAEDLRALLRRYLNTRWAGAGRFNADGSKLLFRTNITGSGQVWRIPADGGWPEQVTFYDDSVSVAEYSPAESDLILFGKGEGGDERLQFYLCRDDGSSIRPLTDDPSTVHRWGSWAPGGRKIAWTANERDPRHFDVHLYDLDRGESELFMQRDAFLSAGEFSPGGEELLVTQWESNVNTHLYLADVESGEYRWISPDGDDSVFQTPRFLPGTEWIYVITDYRRDLKGLARIHRETGELEWVERKDYQMGNLTVGPDGDYLAYSVNREGFGEIEIRETENFEKLPDPDVPRGVQLAGKFSPEGDALTVQVSGPKSPNDLWRYELGTGTATRLTKSATGGMPTEQFVVPEVKRYESFDGLEVSGLFFEPEGERPAHGWPTVVNAHGGPESQSRPNFSPLTQLWLELGMAVFQPNVRGSAGYGREFLNLDNKEKREDSVRDLIEGVDHLVDRGLADEDRIAVTGGSYGGYMVLASMTLFPDRFAAGIDVVGIANFVTFLENTGDYRRAIREAEYGSLEKDREMLEEISPIHKVDRIEAPLLIIHGENDPRVPVGEARQVHEALQDHGVVSELLVFDDEGHGIVKLENRVVAWQHQMDFLRRHLLGEDPDPET